MPVLPESPRARRRLLWSVGGAVLLAVGATIAFAIPNKAPKVEAVTGTVPAQLAVDTKQRLSAADRRAIDTLLDRFIPAAVDRRDPAAAWALAGPEMRESSSLADFRRGASPVPEYPANEANYHHWRAIDVEKNAVVLNILVHPRNPKKIGDWVFSIQAVKGKGRWLVNRIYTIAVMNPPTRPATVTHELGPADYATPPATQRSTGTATPNSHSYLLPVVGVVALVLLVPLLLGIGALGRARKWRRAVNEGGRTSLPPLPSSYRRDPEGEGGAASHS